MVTEREFMGCEPVGLTIQSVEIRDVQILPQSLEDAMSRQAQAERERQARNILGQAETEIADKFSLAARDLSGQPHRSAFARNE